MPTPTTLLSLPIEIRLQIYNHVLSTSGIHSFRPQRKIGWNRPHADLSNPALLFESDAPVALKQLFHSKLTKGDHTLILEAVLHHAKILIVDHADFTALLKLANLPNSSSSNPASGQGRLSLANVVKDNLRTLDFSDRMDEIVCQPNDIVKLVRGLPGLKAVHLTSKHVQRYSGTIDEHVDFARERADRERAKLRAIDTGSSTTAAAGLAAGPHDNSLPLDNSPVDIDNTAAELRRLTLRSPMTDGTRMMISPAIFNRSLPARATAARSASTTAPEGTTSAVKDTTTWVVVDLSMIVWQHFLYTGPPYRDHWRTVKMSTLLDVAERRNVHVVMNFRNVEFDPCRLPTISSPSHGHGTYPPANSTSFHSSQHPATPSTTSVASNSQSPQQQQRIPTTRTSTRPWTPRRQTLLQSGVFKGEMSTADWTLRLRHGGAAGLEYSVRQRRAFDRVVGQEGCGLVRCRHWHWQVSGYVAGPGAVAGAGRVSKGVVGGSVAAAVAADLSDRFVRIALVLELHHDGDFSTAMKDIKGSGKE